VVDSEGLWGWVLLALGWDRDPGVLRVLLAPSQPGYTVWAPRGWAGRDGFSPAFSPSHLLLFLFSHCSGISHTENSCVSEQSKAPIKVPW